MAPQSPLTKTTASDSFPTFRAPWLSNAFKDVSALAAACFVVERSGRQATEKYKDPQCDHEHENPDQKEISPATMPQKGIEEIIYRAAP